MYCSFSYVSKPTIILKQPLFNMLEFSQRPGLVFTKKDQDQIKIRSTLRKKFQLIQWIKLVFTKQRSLELKRSKLDLFRSTI